MQKLTSLTEKIVFPENLMVKMQFMELDEYPLHLHENAIEIIYVLEGKIELEASIYKREICAGDFKVINNLTHHYLKNGNNCSLVLFHFDTKYFSEHIFDITTKIFCSNDVSGKKEELKRILDDLIGLLLQDNLDTQNIEKMYIECIYCLLNHFQTWSIRGRNISSINDPTTNMLQQNRIQRIINYIYQNYSGKITLDDLAYTESLNKYYISHLFTAILGTSFQEFLNSVRVDESRILLHGSDYTITQIAEMCGFSSISLYRKHFISYFNATPIQLRKYYKDKTIATAAPKYKLYSQADVIKKLSTKYRISVHGTGQPLQKIQKLKIDNVNSSVHNAHEFACKSIYVYIEKLAMLFNSHIADDLVKMYKAHMIHGIILEPESIWDYLSTFDDKSGQDKLKRQLSKLQIPVVTNRTLADLNILPISLANHLIDDYTIDPNLHLLSIHEQFLKLSHSSKNYYPSVGNLFDQHGLKRATFHLLALLSRFGTCTSVAEPHYLLHQERDEFRLLLSLPDNVERYDYYVDLSSFSNEFYVHELRISQNDCDEALCWKSLGSPGFDQRIFNSIQKKCVPSRNIFKTSLKENNVFKLFLTPGEIALLILHTIY